MTVLEAAARSYATRGWPVFPLEPNSKIPYKGSRGFKDATTDENRVTDWWTQFPASNIGVSTGKKLVVLDVDPRHGGDDSLRSLEQQYGPLPETLRTMTSHACFYSVCLLLRRK